MKVNTVYPDPLTTSRMDILRALVAELELEADAIKNRLAVMDPSGHLPSGYHPDRHYLKGQASAISHALRLVHQHFRHDHMRHATDDRKCAACGQDLMHEVHWRIDNEGQRYAEPKEKAR